MLCVCVTQHSILKSRNPRGMGDGGGAGSGGWVMTVRDGKLFITRRSELFLCFFVGIRQTLFFMLPIERFSAKASKHLYRKKMY